MNVSGGCYVADAVHAARPVLFDSCYIAQMTVFRLFVISLPLVLIVCGLLTGCAARPQVKVERAVWTDIGEDAAVLNIEMLVSNPGKGPVELREMSYRVSHGGRHVYEGRRSTMMTISPGGSSPVTIPAVVRRTDEQLPTLDRAGVSGSVQFIEPGRLALVMRDLGLPRPRTSFTGTAMVE